MVVSNWVVVQRTSPVGFGSFVTVLRDLVYTGFVLVLVYVTEDVAYDGDAYETEYEVGVA
jgi:hypothetical protein